MNRNTEKYHGIIPAFYACYDDNGEISVERTQALAEYYINKGVKGLYVGGSSGECIYLGKEERKVMLEAVMSVAKGRITIIAHVACNNTRNSQDLARHAESLGVDAIAAIPPIYFKLPDHAMAKYWNDISSFAPNTDFVIYNIPGLAGVELSSNLLNEMKKNPRVIGVKNSSMPTMDIMKFKDILGEDSVVFNGPDEQLLAGLAIGADGGIGGTYGVMPELYLQIFDSFYNGNIARARAIQSDCLNIIFALCACKGSMYAVIKEILREKSGIDCGGVRAPLPNLEAEDMPKVKIAKNMIEEAEKKWL